MRLPKPTLAWLVVLSVLVVAVMSARPAGAKEIWTVRSGVTTVALNSNLLHDLGLSVTGIRETAPFPPEMKFLVEEPHWSFAISPASDLSFRVSRGMPVAYGFVAGSIVHSGSIGLKDAASGQIQDLGGLEMAYVPATVQSAGGSHPTDTLILRDPATHEPVFDLVDSMMDLRAGASTLWIHYLNIRVTESWAAKMHRPDLAGLVIGALETMAGLERTGGQPSPGPPPLPDSTGHTDVSLGGLSSIQQDGHDGIYPAGTAALTMSTTSCNLGTADVPWLAPMQENHPLIAMALYRLMNGRLEQIGVSWMKHGFFALSNHDCTPCQHPSDGSFLGVGCSDTYAPTNNGNRNYLGPRKEVNPFTAVWTCLGSYFSGYQQDCIRRQGSQGLGPIDHRLNALDADLALPGATYFYEADYLVREDTRLFNNIGSRMCTMSWNGNMWQFTTPSTNNPLVNGPTIERYGDLRSQAAIDSTDGYYILAVQVTDLGGGQYHYEYALFNRNSDLGARSFSLPIAGAAITNIGFHDSDYDPVNDWQVTLQDTTITWQTDNYETNPDANYLVYDYMYNFRFDADQPPGDMNATVEMFKVHTPRAMVLATRGPSSPSGVRTPASASAIRLEPCRPNPLAPETTIRFTLVSPRNASVEVFDPQGRRLRTLVNGPMGGGAHEAQWDGTDEMGRRLASGVYYVRLRAGHEQAVRSVTLVR